MIIKDKTQGKLISENAKFAKSFFDRLFGLLDPKNPRFLIIKTHFGIHSFFMGEPIDVVLLDDSYKVKKLKSLHPYRLFFYNPIYSVVIEMPEKTIKKLGIRLNDKIVIE